MIIKQAKVKVCKSCKSVKRISNEEYGCDCCKKPIRIDQNDYTSLDLTVFYQNSTERSDTKHYQCCSWNCVLKLVDDLQNSPNACDYFINLPSIMCDSVNNDFNYKGFVSAIRKFKPKITS